MFLLGHRIHFGEIPEPRGQKLVSKAVLKLIPRSQKHVKKLVLSFFQRFRAIIFHTVEVQASVG